jgi:hypothetical protein
MLMLLSLLPLVGCQNPIIVSIPGLGLVKGLQESPQDPVKFMGIPYADNPKRFEPSTMVKPWHGIKDATKFGNICIQADGSGYEDCLFINIFTPPNFNLSGKPLPVAVSELCHSRFVVIAFSDEI